MALSPDGRRLVTGSSDQTARIWDAESGQEVLVLSHSNVVSSVAFSPDGQRVVTGVGKWRWASASRGEARVSDAQTGEVLLGLPYSKAVCSVAFSPDGQRILVGSADGTAKVWDVTTGQELLSVSHTNIV